LFSPAYDALVRNTKAFKEAVAQTLTELAHRGVTLAPATVQDTIERQITTVAQRLGIQVRSAWRYFDASVTADRLAQAPPGVSAPAGGLGSPVPGRPRPGELARVHAGSEWGSERLP
jgi:hypothetical protein